MKNLNTLPDLRGIYDSIQRTGAKYSEVLIDDLDLDLYRVLSEYKQKKIFEINKNNKPTKIHCGYFFKNIDHEYLKGLGFDISLERIEDWPEADNSDYKNIYLLNSNDCYHNLKLNNYIDFYLNNPDDIIIVWDYDNHHWLHGSFILSAYSDYYFPAHDQNIYRLSLLATKNIKKIPCAVQQFSRNDIVKYKDDILNCNRYSYPIGFHSHYKNFKFRNSVIDHFSKFSNSIGYTINNNYDANNVDRNIKDWYSHTTSFVAPVSGDLPIRFFDSLITGSIPIVPYFLNDEIKTLKFKNNQFYMFDLDDLNNISDIIDGANNLFYTTKNELMAERIDYVVNNHHISNRVLDILDFVVNDNLR